MRNLIRAVIVGFSLSLIIGYSFFRHSQQKLKQRQAPVFASSSKNAQAIGSGGWEGGGFVNQQKTTKTKGNNPPAIMASSKSRRIIIPEVVLGDKPTTAKSTPSTLDETEFLVPVRYHYPDPWRRFHPSPLVTWNENRIGFLFPNAEETAPQSVKSKFFTSSKSAWAVIVVEDIRELFRIEPAESSQPEFSQNPPVSTYFRIPTLDQLIELQSTERSDWETGEFLSPHILTHGPIGGWSELEHQNFKVPY